MTKSEKAKKRKKQTLIILILLLLLIIGAVVATLIATGVLGTGGGKGYGADFQYSILYVDASGNTVDAGNNATLPAGTQFTLLVKLPQGKEVGNGYVGVKLDENAQALLKKDTADYNLADALEGFTATKLDYKGDSACPAVLFDNADGTPLRASSEPVFSVTCTLNGDAAKGSVIKLYGIDNANLGKSAEEMYYNQTDSPYLGGNNVIATITVG